MEAKSKKISFFRKENAMYILLLLVLVTLFTAQLIIKVNRIIGDFSAKEVFADGYLYDDPLIQKANVTIELSHDVEPDYPEIYINGERVAFFDEKSKTITIETDSTMEVYVGGGSDDLRAKITFVDPELSLVSNMTDTKLKHGFNVIGRFVFK